MRKASGPSDARSLVGITLSGGYKTERLIDEAGRGIVLAAKDSAGHAVAVKILRAEAATEEMLSRVSREASVLCKLADRHVVPVLDVGHDLEIDLVYLVMPLLRGVDAGDLLRRASVLSPKAAARIVLQASSALVAAHAAGIVFRDLRLPKVFLEDGDDGEVVVRVLGPGLREPDTDGLEMWSTGSEGGRSGSHTGAAARSDRRADVFGLGAILYQLLSGKVPRPADPDSSGDFAVAPVSGRKHRRSDPSGRPPSPRGIPSIQDLAPWVEPKLALALQPAITADQRRRYPSAEAFSEMLRAVAGTGELTADMLAPLDAGARSVVAERADHDADPLVGHSLGGRYKVVRLIGRGGMGGVYEAEGEGGRRVAAKVIFRSALGQDDQQMRRFIREARTATSIDSQHVVKTFELGTDLKLGSPFIVMELLDGVDVAHLLQDRGPMQPQAVVRIFSQAARGLAAAHAVGIVHRDVKPANLFVHDGAADRASAPSAPNPALDMPSATGHRVLVKVCDFGVAKRSEDGGSHDLTLDGGVLGSPLYMSPEQAKTAAHVDHRTDVWGLCISMYQALCGHPPWDPSSSLAELLLDVCTERIPPLNEVAPWISTDLAAVVHKGLAREPEDRWQSMDELIAALSPHTGGTEDLCLDEITSVPPEQLASAPPIASLRAGRGRVRSSRGPRHVVSRAETLDQDAHFSAPPPSPPRGRAGLFVGAGVVIAAVAGILALRPPAGAPAADATTAAQPALKRARLPVPEGATVRVNGAPSQVEAGAVELIGEAGDAFDVVVRVGDAERAVRVILMKDGRAQPDRIEAPAASVASSAAAATSSAAAAASVASTAASASASARASASGAAIASASGAAIASTPPVSKAASPPDASSTKRKNTAAPSPTPPTVQPRETW